VHRAPNNRANDLHATIRVFLLINRWEHRDYQSCGLQLSPGPVTNIEGPFGVMKGHDGRLVGTAEAPQKADRIAAAPKTSALCHFLP
jgi:hypothetical protein